MRRRAGWLVLLASVLFGWSLALFSVLVAFAALIGLMRLDLLDRLASIYVGAATLRTLLGDYTLLLLVLIGTLVVAAGWTAFFRLQALSWARARRSTVTPRQLDEGRRWAALRQVGLLLVVAAAGSVLGLLALALGLMPDGDAGGAGWALMAGFAFVAVIGLALYAWSRRRLQSAAPGYRGGLLGFEMPLLAALAFGLVAWFGMREAVIVSANNVDTPGSLAPFDRAVDLFPDFGLAFYLRGERYLARHGVTQDDADLVAALDNFTRAAELDGDFPATYLARGRVLVALGRYDEAIADADRLIELRPEHPGGYAVRALARAETGDLTGAGEDIAVATRPLPPDARGWDAHFIRCLALAAVERTDEAKEACSRVLEINPDQLVALDTLVLIAGDEGDYDAALGYADRALAISPDNARMWVNRGFIQRTLGNWEAADADLSRAIEIDPEDPRAYQDRAVVRLYLDRVAEALADADAGVLLDPSLYYTRLYVARYAGEHERAIADATNIIGAEGADSPNLPYLYSARGLARVEAGDASAGMQDLDEALRIDPEQAAIYDRRGYARYLLGDYAGAESDFNSGILRIGPLTPQGRAELYYHRALVLSATGRAAAAQTDLEEAAASVEIPLVRRQIDELQRNLSAGN
jgi:tetratricopeptide (TPR) repeat protein